MLAAAAAAGLAGLAGLGYERIGRQDDDLLMSSSWLPATTDPTRLARRLVADSIEAIVTGDWLESLFGQLTAIIAVNCPNNAPRLCRLRFCPLCPWASVLGATDGTAPADQEGDRCRIGESLAGGVVAAVAVLVSAAGQ